MVELGLGLNLGVSLRVGLGEGLTPGLTPGLGGIKYDKQTSDNRGALPVLDRIKKCLGAKENIRLGRDGQSVGYWIGAGVGSGKLMEPTRSYGGKIYDKKIYIS